MNTSRSFAVPVLAAFAFLFASVMPARAQSGTLEGETFETIEIGKNTATCDPGGLIRYFVEGTAVGPQPGTFEETGEIKFDSASGQILGLAILGTKVKILDVTLFAIAGSHATFVGRAEVNNVVENYRIDVDDLGEPGTGVDAIRIITDSYATGGTLTGGNIQVHN